MQLGRGKIATTEFSDKKGRKEEKEGKREKEKKERKKEVLTTPNACLFHTAVP